MILPNGITGFYDKETNQPPYVDGKRFKQECYRIVTHHGGKVLDFNEPEYPKNFYDVEVQVVRKHIHLLLNEHYPYLAFALKVNMGDIVFIEIPELFKEINLQYKVMGVKELNERLIFDSQSSRRKYDLNRAELEQIFFWKPDRVADVIFNYWD